jgi:hypothetical protein
MYSLIENEMSGGISLLENGLGFRSCELIVLSPHGGAEVTCDPSGSGPYKNQRAALGRIFGAGEPVRTGIAVRVPTLGRPVEIAVAQLTPTHLKGVPDCDAGENRPRTAPDAVIEKRPQARCGTLAFLWLS